MNRYTVADRVLLHLHESLDPPPEGPVPTTITSAGLSDAVGGGGGGDSLARRIELLAALRDLERGGLVSEAAATGENGRTGYVLTDEGRARATTVRERVATERIAIERDGETTTHSVSDAVAFLGAEHLVEVLVAAVPDGTIRDDDMETGVVGRGDELTAIEDRLDALADGDGGRRSPERKGWGRPPSPTNSPSALTTGGRPSFAATVAPARRIRTGRFEGC